MNLKINMLTSYILLLIVFPILCFKDSFSKLNSTSYPSVPVVPSSASITVKYTLTVPSGIGFIFLGIENSTSKLFKLKRSALMKIKENIKEYN